MSTPVHLQPVETSSTSIGWTLMYHCNSSSRSDTMVPSLEKYGDYLEERTRKNRARLATLPDIINARLSSPLEGAAWRMPYFQTLSGEYGGLSRTGIPLLVVAHGIGPMATVRGAVDFIQHTSHRMRYGERSFWKKNLKRSVFQMITGPIDDDARKWIRYNSERLACHPQAPRFQEEFWKLYDGEYGGVHVIEMKRLPSYYREFRGLSYSEACEDPLVQARLGPRAEEFLKRLDDLNEEAGTPKHPVYYPQVTTHDTYHRYADLQRGPVGYLLDDSLEFFQERGNAIRVGLWALGFTARFVILKSDDQPLEEIRSGPGDIFIDPLYEQLA